MFGCVPKLKYVYHDVMEVAKFPELAHEIYMEKKWISSIGLPILEPKRWIIVLYNSAIMKLLEIPHFGRGEDVNACMKKLLETVHGGFFWMEIPIPIYVDLI